MLPELGQLALILALLLSAVQFVLPLIGARRGPGMAILNEDVAFPRERLAEIGATPSIGTVADSYDNALAETVNGLYKNEVIHRQGPWRDVDAVELATLAWVHWFNTERLHSSLGDIRPVCNSDGPTAAPASR